MFERRLKIILGLLAVSVIVILSRAAQVQIVRHDYWKGQAIDATKLTHLVDAPRGRILDRNGKVLAQDTPCIDACMEYRALTSPPDAEWVKQKALDRLRARLGEGWAKPISSAKVKAFVDEEIDVVKSEISSMWQRLSEVSGRPIDEIDDARESVVRRVEMRQRYVWYKHYEKALNKEGDKLETASWKKWITDGGDDSEAVDGFHTSVAEEMEAHVILPAISSELQNELGKNIAQYPGLVLRPGTHRTYPYDDLACHVLGHLAHVDQHDLDENKVKALDDLHAYLRNDLIGKTGIEALCEPTLRGTRGRVERVQGEEAIVSGKEPVGGEDVRLSIDIELQKKIQSAFMDARLRNNYGVVAPGDEHVLLHGAAIVMDVSTNEVLAMVSYPTYDENKFDELYASLRSDEVNTPLANRATMAQREPGSTIKPFCGLVGISDGVVGVHEGIECRGILYIGKERFPFGKCWIDAAMRKTWPDDPNLNTAHHPFPFPHEGHDGNPNGWLEYSEALERSCNSYFENVADRLGIERLSQGYSRVGFGRHTGIGIGEAKGFLPNKFPGQVPALRRSIGFFGGIGQGFIRVTPIQMANGASMIARSGIWMRPHLVLPGGDGKLPAIRNDEYSKIPERVDLNLPADALVAARKGMFDVVNSPSGTGPAIVVRDRTLEQALDQQLKDLGVCGKTGTAQATPFSVPVRDEKGRPMLNDDGEVILRLIHPSVPGRLSAEAPWYRASDPEGKVIDHAWYIGFAPANHPRIAFAVMVEYGGSGGIAAASVAREALRSCMIEGYLPVPETHEKAATHGQ